MEIKKDIEYFTIKNVHQGEAKKLCEYFKIAFRQLDSYNFTIHHKGINLSDLSKDINKTTGIKLIF